MEIISVSNSDIKQLRDKIDAHLRSIRKRDLTYYVVAHTSKAASINIIATGKKGSANADLILNYDEYEGKWVIHSRGKIYYLDSFEEIKLVTKQIINNLFNIILKF